MIAPDEPDELAVRDVRVPDADDSRPIEWWRDMVTWLRGKVDAKRESGDVKGLPGTLSALDTAEAAYNRRERQRLWDEARRAMAEAEQEPEEPPNPIAEQLGRLDDRRKRLLGAQLNAALAEHAYRTDDGPPAQHTEADYLASVTQAVDELLGLSDEDADDEYRRLTAEDRQARTEPAPPEPAQEPVGRRMTPDTPSERVRAPEAMVIDIGSRADHDRTWQPLERRERP